MELNELVVDKNQEMHWRETARWIKFEEDVEEDTARWGKPHVASLSFRSLLELRKTIAHGKSGTTGQGLCLALEQVLLDNFCCYLAPLCRHVNSVCVQDPCRVCGDRPFCSLFARVCTVSPGVPLFIPCSALLLSGTRQLQWPAMPEPAGLGPSFGVKRQVWSEWETKMRAMYQSYQCILELLSSLRTGVYTEDMVHLDLGHCSAERIYTPIAAWLLVEKLCPQSVHVAGSIAH